MDGRSPKLAPVVVWRDASPDDYPASRAFSRFVYFVYLKRRLLKGDAVKVQELLVEVLGGGEHEPAPFRGGQPSGDVQRRCHVLDLLDICLVDEEHVVEPAAADEPILTPDLLRRGLFAGGGEEDVARELLVTREIRSVEKRLLAHRPVQLEVAERPAQPGLEGLVLCGRDTVDDAPRPLGGDGIHVVFALDEHEAPVAAVLPVQGHHRMRRRARTGYGGLWTYRPATARATGEGRKKGDPKTAPRVSVKGRDRPIRQRHPIPCRKTA